MSVNGRRWEVLLKGSGPLPRAVALWGCVFVVFWLVLGVVAFETRGGSDQDARLVGFAHLDYFYGARVVLWFAPVVVMVVGYVFGIAAGRVPLLWWRETDGVVAVASTFGRFGAPRRSLELDGSFQLRLFRDGINPTIRVADGTSHGRTLRVRCFGPVCRVAVDDVARQLGDLGIRVTVRDELAE